MLFMWELKKREKGEEEPACSMSHQQGYLGASIRILSDAGRLLFPFSL